MPQADIENLMKHSNRPNIANVLIIDDDPETARFMLEIMARKGIHGTIAGNENAANTFLEKDDISIVFISDKISQNNNLSPTIQRSFELLRKIRTNMPELAVIMISKNETTTNLNQTVKSAVDAIRIGCHDFLTKPLDCKKIESILNTFLPKNHVATIDSANGDAHDIYRIVGRSAKLAQTINLAKKVAPTSAPVLINGESGTGKELISCLIHHESKRAQSPYIKINCAALSDSLLESELFGHEKGAFTGAHTRRKGRFEMAHGGTLLLDEITETPLKFQAKLLRILEQQDFERVGGNENIKINVRIISTTNRNLLQQVREGKFRQDLYYRLCGIKLVIPPLRERPEDLPDLIWYFVNIYSYQAQRQITKLDPAMMDVFEKCSWPGNVRQLRNAVMTSLIVGNGNTLSLNDITWLLDELQLLQNEIVSDCDIDEQDRQIAAPQDRALGGTPLVDIERQAILDTLRKTAGNQTKAAKVLGISDRTLRVKIRKYRQEGILQLI